MAAGGVILAAAVATFLLCLYVEIGDDLFLVAASTTLALVVYWLAAERPVIGGRR